MEYERKGVTIIWQLENTKYIGKRKMELYSPVVPLDVLDRTKWKLGVHRVSESNIWLTLGRETEDIGLEKIGLHYKFSIDEFQGPPTTRKRIYTGTFSKNQRCPEVTINYQKIGKSLAPDTITIRCKIWKQKGSISKTGRFFLRTRLKTERCVYVKMVENFSRFYIHDIRTWQMFSSAGERLVKVNLVLYRRYPLNKSIVYDLKIEIIPKENQDERFIGFKLFILDNYGNKTDIGKFDKEFALKSYSEFPLPDVSKKYLTENSNLYLLNDTLSLHCELSFCSGIEYEKIERSEYESDSCDDENQTNLLNAVELLVSKEDTFSDIKLQTTNEIFPAHIAVLSAHSPIFEAMFKSNMTETIEKCVHIDDVEAETIYNMLVFLYSDTLAKLDWKDAIKLYFAADKYQIESLKSRCIVLLKQSLDLSNCCVLLLLADMHQDKNLKRSVHGYIAEYGKEILHCEQWRDLEKNLPQLAIETLRDIFLGNLSI